MSGNRVYTDGVRPTEVAYSIGSNIDHYTYIYTIDSDATIAVVISSSDSLKKLYKTKWNMGTMF